MASVVATRRDNHRDRSKDRSSSPDMDKLGLPKSFGSRRHFRRSSDRYWDDQIPTTKYDQMTQSERDAEKRRIESGIQQMALFDDAQCKVLVNRFILNNNLFYIFPWYYSMLIRGI